MEATGENVRRLTDFGFNPVWSPDGTKVLFATQAIGTTQRRPQRGQQRTLDGGPRDRDNDADLSGGCGATPLVTQWPSDCLLGD